MKRILIVDDEPFFLQVLCDALGGSFSIVTAPSAERAVQIMEEPRDAAAGDGGRFDLIITDLHLPGMDGFQFARYIKTKNRLDRFTPVIMLTEHPITKEEARQHGCTAYIPKSDLNRVVSLVRILMASR